LMAISGKSFAVLSSFWQIWPNTLIKV